MPAFGTAPSASLDQLLRVLDTSPGGLSSTEAASRLSRFGPNSLRTHRVSALAVLARQFHNAVLWLLAATALLSFFLGDDTEAVTIGSRSDYGASPICCCGWP